MRKFKLALYDRDVAPGMIICEAREYYFDNIEAVQTKIAENRLLSKYHVEECVEVDIGGKALNIWSVIDE